MVGSPDVECLRGSDSGGGVGGLLYSERAGVTSYAHSDTRGDIVARSSGAGAITYAASYEGYGKPFYEDGTNTDNIGQNTKEVDAEIGLVYFGKRYYDQEAGVWTSRDPLGFADGLNLYQYVHQNPWNEFDPDGQFSAATAMTMVAGAVMGIAIDYVFQRIDHTGEGEFQYNWKRGAIAGLTGALSGGVGVHRIAKLISMAEQSVQLRIHDESMIPLIITPEN